MFTSANRGAWGLRCKLDLALRRRLASRGKLGSLAAILLAAVPTASRASASDSQSNSTGQPAVGLFEVAAPHVSSFILHGTLPVPPSTYPRPDGLMPFAVIDSDGTPINAQVESVTFYPDEIVQGADVVEITARVHVPSGTPPGTHIQYAVIVAPHAATSFTPTASVQTLLSTPNAVTMKTRDVFGHVYSADLLAGSSGSKVELSGAFRRQVRDYAYMVPAPGTQIGAPTGALQRMMAVHSYVGTWNGEDVVSLDLRIHNGTSGASANSPLDDPQDKLYFDELDIVVPQGWNLIPDVQDAGWGTPVAQGAQTIYPIVKAQAGGKLNMIPQQGRFERRLVLAKSTSLAAATSIVSEEWLAFCQPGGTSNVGLYSWWNRLTARYFPQRRPLPKWDFMGKAATLNKLKNEYSSDLDHVVTGKGIGSYPFYVDQLGWAMPYGTKYGGMTGGSDIYLYDGVLAAWAASTEGYRHYQLYHRMYTDRHPVVLYDVDGEPTQLSEWVTHGPQFDYVDMQFYLTLLSGPDPFGLTTAPKFQSLAVAAAGKQPAYEADLLSYKPIDIQHHIRWMRSPKVLIWLGNDALAKDDMRMEAELLRLSYHAYPTAPNGGYVPSGMLADIKQVEVNGSAGFACGRDEAWTVDGMCSAYSINDSVWRAGARDWFNTYSVLVRQGQAACSGFIQRLKTSKDFNGQYFVRRSTETSMIDQSLISMIESVYRNFDPQRESQLEWVVTKELYAMVSSPSWSVNLKGPISSIAVAPLSGPPFCHATAAQAPDADKFLPWSSLAYGFELTNDPLFLQRAADMSGASSVSGLLNAQQNMHYGNHENRAGLLALAQIIWHP